MLRARFLHLRDKQAFRPEGGTLRLLGQPIEVAKGWRKEGIGLVHISDLDAQRGSGANFDVYDKLTYLMHVQVECGTEKRFIERLLGINARVVVDLPTRLPLLDWKEKRKLLVGRVAADFAGDLAGVHDVLVENATFESVKRFHTLGRRVLVWEKDFDPAMKGYVFAVIG